MSKLDVFVTQDVGVWSKSILIAIDQRSEYFIPVFLHEINRAKLYAKPVETDQNSTFAA